MSFIVDRYDIVTTVLHSAEPPVTVVETITPVTGVDW